MPDIGVLASFDFTGDDEVRRWIPTEVGIVTTRTRPVPMQDNLRFVSDLGTRQSSPARPVSWPTSGLRPRSTPARRAASPMGTTANDGCEKACRQAAFVDHGRPPVPSSKH